MSTRPLPVCPMCGWHAGVTHARECNPGRGAAADRLAKEMPNIPSTKLGYGFGRLTFEFAEGKSLTLRVNVDGTFSVDKLHWIGEYDALAMRHLVGALFTQRTWSEAGQHE